jgi:hypothetical protein
VADDTGIRILIWNQIPNSSGVAADLVVGQPDLGSRVANCGPSDNLSIGPSPYGMSYPLGLAVNGTKLYVSDRSNNRVMVWNTIPTHNGQPADTVIGQPDLYRHQYYSTGSSTTVFYWPNQINYSNNSLAVADQNNDRVLLISQ